MKVLVIGHTYIAPINREKWKVFANKYPQTQIKVLIPKIWPANLFRIDAGDLSEYNTKNCEFVALDTFKTGNEVLYGYSFLGLIKLLRSFKPDIIHVEQGDNAFCYFQTILLSKIFCRKAKFTFFTWVNWVAKKGWKYKLIWNFIEKINLFFSKGAFVGNDDAGKILQGKKFKKPILELLQLGVNKQFFYPAKKVKQEKKYIGFLGRIIPEKGVFDLVNAFSLVAKDFPGWNLLFVGDGNAKKDLINYVEQKDLRDQVEFAQPVKHEKVAKLFSRLDIFALPSYDTPEWREQFGHVLIEAMSCKVPVIGSNGGYIAQVISDSGLIFEQKNIKLLSDCLKQLMLDDNLRISLSEKGYKRFKANYSYEIIAEKTYAFWRGLM